MRKTLNRKQLAGTKNYNNVDHKKQAEVCFPPNHFNDSMKRLMFPINSGMLLFLSVYTKGTIEKDVHRTSLSFEVKYMYY